MTAQFSSISYSMTYSAMCPAIYPTPPVERSATFSSSSSDLAALWASAASVAVSSVPLRPAVPAEQAGPVAVPVEAIPLAASDDGGLEVEGAGVPEIEAEPGPYSIRIPYPPGDAWCPQCRNVFLASGPTGFLGEQPICDLCLFEGSRDLGMVMALTAVARTFGATDSTSDDEYEQASEELATFARLYEIFAAKRGPARPFRLPSA